jgi:ankyrin repeat protein
LELENNLLEAVERGDLNACVDLIARGADPNARGAGGATALMRADRRGHLPIVSALLARGADVNAQEEHGYSALMTAASFGRVESCRLLIEAGARLDLRGRSHEQVLAIAAGAGRRDVCSLLLDAGAEIGAADRYLHTALSSAAKAGHLSVCELLVTRGAEVSESELEAAAVAREDIFALMMDSVASPSSDSLSRVLYVAAEGGNVGNCERIMASGAEPTLDSLRVAAFNGHTEVCRALLAHGASVNVAETEVTPPLHAAVRSDSVELCAMLIAAGADVTRTSSRPGWTPLYEAIEWGAAGAADICRLLIKSGANVAPECANAGDLTPFQFAVKRGRESVVRLFADEYGEDPRQRTVDNKTMLELAASQPEVSQLLRALITDLEVQESMPEQPELLGIARQHKLSPL